MAFRSGVKRCSKFIRVKNEGIREELQFILNDKRLRRERRIQGPNSSGYINPQAAYCGYDDDDKLTIKFIDKSKD